MKGPSIQRLALLLVIFGGFLEITGAVSGDYSGLPTFGGPLMLLGFFIGIIGFLIGVFEGNKSI